MLKKLYRFLHPSWQTVFLDYPVVAKPRYGHGHNPHPGLFSIIESERESYIQLINKIQAFFKDLADLRETNDDFDPTSPAWNNGFLPGMDILNLYGILCSIPVTNYIEIGSGNSSKIAFMAKSRHRKEMHITSIDPNPRTEVNILADKCYKDALESMDLKVFDALKANDVLFIDNSHRILPNSDATVVFLDILPRLAAGVIVQFHDIYLPYDYPQFMCDRYYSEQYGLACFLLSNPEKYKVILPNYFISEDPQLSSMYLDFWDSARCKNIEHHGGSFWIQIAS